MYSILVEVLMVYSHTSSSITHINLRSATPSVSASATPVVVTDLIMVATVNFTIVDAIAAIWW